MQALTEVWPANRVGVRFSPFSNANDMADSDPLATFGYAVDRANDFGLAYLHLVEGQIRQSRDSHDAAATAALRRRFDGVYMANNGYDRELAARAIETGTADLVAFGRLFIANPDLVARLARQAPLNQPDVDTFYGGDAKGYTDYPTLAETKTA